MFKIFSPFNQVKSNSNVFICTWNISEYKNMKLTNNKIEKANKKQILVGFSKETHNCKELLVKLLEYQKNGWVVKVMPSFHSKIWTIDNVAYVGSSNWVPDCIHNYMHKTVITPRLKNFIKEWWSKGYTINNKTKLWLLPQK